MLLLSLALWLCDVAQQCTARSDRAGCLQGVFEDDDSIHIVMELCLGGALMDRVKQVSCQRMHQA